MISFYLLYRELTKFSCIQQFLLTPLKIAVMRTGQYMEEGVCSTVFK